MDTSIPVLTQNNQNENGTNSSMVWDNLTQAEREVVIAVVFAGSPEEARKKLTMSHSTFYRRWARLKGYYNQLMQEFPKKACEILIS